MSIKRVKQIQKENDKKRRLGLVGPDVSDETMLSALRKAEKSLQVEQTASKSRRPRLRRSKLLLFAMVCLMAFIPVGTWQVGDYNQVDQDYLEAFVKILLEKTELTFGMFEVN